MARDEIDIAAASAIPFAALANPQVRLLGQVSEGMVAVFRDQVAASAGEDPLAIELCTTGGDAEMGRLLAQEVRQLRQTGRRVVFLGKTTVYSAGVTMMAAFPVADRFLTRDAVLLIHCRRMDEQVHFEGPLKSCLIQAKVHVAKMEAGIELEREGFCELIEGSDVSFNEVTKKAVTNWYVPAQEALDRRLIAGLI